MLLSHTQHSALRTVRGRVAESGLGEAHRIRVSPIHYLHIFHLKAFSAFYQPLVATSDLYMQSCSSVSSGNKEKEKYKLHLPQSLL